jgi:two-component system NtrC family sensor kinase
MLLAMARFGITMTAMKIMIADDSEVMLRLLEGWLRKWNYEVVVARNGAEAWRLFQQEPVTLLLTDWMMPEMSGLELIQRIRALELPGHVYIVLLTGRNEKTDLVEAMEAGADDYVAKPVDPEELRVRVREGERILRLEKRLVDQNRQLRETQSALVQSEKLASLGHLAAGIAHEINNPIAFVTNNLAVLERDVSALTAVLEIYRQERERLAQVAPQRLAEIAKMEAECDFDWISENQRQLFASSRDGLSRVRKIVSNLRDFACLDEADFDDLDITAALQSTAAILHPELEGKQLTLAADFAATRPVLCHPGKIKQAFYSVLLNAIEASAAGGTINLRTVAGAESVVIEVEDHGCGIDQAHLSRIFEPFFTTKPVGRGTGLGLAASYGIVRDHGGSIGVDSVAGRGTNFRITLPLHPVPSGNQQVTP